MERTAVVIFALTFVLRMLSLALLTIVVHIIAHEHILLSRSFVKSVVARGLSDESCETDLLSGHLWLTREVRKINDGLGTGLGLLLLTMGSTFVALGIGMYEGIIHLELFLSA